MDGYCRRRNWDWVEAGEAEKAMTAAEIAQDGRASVLPRTDGIGTADQSPGNIRRRGFGV